ncbi:MAG TPA: ribonuclease D [Stackebrandtia sp.]|uniref:ribonuclease D n=1 Tax=Stackebrandtia sp. TaxID=2023065 RepID=UPI002D3BBA0E|nr:ribonuclease D [Stackebrandtia sp.]HZE40183.1 ribonuclease D [Stackebrandtia sp.]
MCEDHPSETPPPVVLTQPRDGVPDVVVDAPALRRTVESLAGGSGPVAIDAERASGFRYLPRAYLIQLRREGAGTSLIDPIRFDNLESLDDALADTEWILHAASQDLPCLTDVGMRPRALFDTELAARLCGFERVGLAALTEKLLGFTLEKHHSAADWSTRPLPADWLVYAALDVELLVDLRNLLDEELTAQGKRAWAAEEFDALINAPAPAPRAEPWRRTSGIHRVRGRRALGRVRSLWTLRDEIARGLDKAPSKIIPDPAIADAAVADPTDFGELIAIPGFQRRHGRGNAKRWLKALAEARRIPEAELPSVTPVSDGPPSTHRWASRDPEAAARLQRARTAVAAIADEHALPAENLLAPATVRALCWRPPRRITEETVADVLRRNNARPWQIGLSAGVLTEALNEKLSRGLDGGVDRAGQQVLHVGVAVGDDGFDADHQVLGPHDDETAAAVTFDADLAGVPVPRHVGGLVGFVQERVALDRVVGGVRLRLVPGRAQLHYGRRSRAARRDALDHAVVVVALRRLVDVQSRYARQIDGPAGGTGDPVPVGGGRRTVGLRAARRLGATATAGAARIPVGEGDHQDHGHGDDQRPDAPADDPAEAAFLLGRHRWRHHRLTHEGDATADSDEAGTREAAGGSVLPASNIAP